MRETEGGERETMILVNEASQYLKECQRMLERSVPIGRMGWWKSGPGRRDGLSRRGQALALSTASCMKNSAGLGQ